MLLLLSVVIAAPAWAADLTITSGQDISLAGELDYDTGYDVASAIDVDGDHTIGLPEALYILQKLSGER